MTSCETSRKLSLGDRLDPKAACDSILAGYAAGMASGGRNRRRDRDLRGDARTFRPIPRSVRPVQGETANIHLGAPKAAKAVGADLSKRKEGWLLAAADRMRESVLRDFEDWKKRGVEEELPQASLRVSP